MVFERFSPASRQVVVTAADYCRASSAQELMTEHLLLGVIAESETTRSAMTSLGVPADVISRQLGVAQVPANRHHQPRTGSFQVPFSGAAKATIDSAVREADDLGHSVVEPEHIMLTLLNAEDGAHVRLLAAANVDRSALRSKLRAEALGGHS